VVRFNATTLWHLDAAEWRRPQHHKRPSASLLRQVWFDVASGHLGYRLVPASTASSTPQQISNGNLLSASSGRHLLSRRCV